MVKVQDLSCGYQQQVITNVSFESHNNLVILGVNGVGKSTLCKALCGVLPYTGEITINAYDLQQLAFAERAKAITYIPAKLESYDTNITVFDFVLMGRYPYKTAFTPYSEADKKIVLDRLREEQLDPEKMIGELSSGQQQLLLITQAFVQASQIILFDEPTANLDPQHAKAFYDALNRLDASVQKVLVTHDLNLARSVGYEILFLSESGVHFYEDPLEFFTKENLKSCYGVDFFIEDKLIGLSYG